jgi:hypothetical protein
VTPRDTFPGYDEPVNIDMDPEDALKVLLEVNGDSGDEDGVEPVRDD